MQSLIVYGSITWLCSHTMSLAKICEPIRGFVKKFDNKYLTELACCQFCQSFWFGFIFHWFSGIIYRTGHGVIFDHFVSWLLITTFSVVLARLLQKRSV